MPDTKTLRATRLWTKYKSAAITTVILTSLLWTVFVAPGASLRIAAVEKYGAALVVTELLFTAGAILMAASVGLEVSGVNRIHRTYLTLKMSRIRVREMASEILESKMFAFGFWMNFMGAVGTSLVLIAAVAGYVPTTGIGLILLLIVDLIATFGWRIPLHMKRKTVLGASRIKIRGARQADIDEYLDLQRQRWTSDNMASREQLVSRFRAYPQGMLVAERNGEIVGMVYAMRISRYDYEKLPSWNEITHDGYCDNADPDGSAIFGVDLTTAPGVGHLAGDKLLIGIARLVIAEGVKAALLGGRLPGYYKVAGTMSAEEYLWAKDSHGRPLDRQVRYYTSVPGLNAVKLLPNYFNDPESLNYGVLLKWRNPLYRMPGRRLWSALFPLLFNLEEMYLKLRAKLRS